MAREKRIRGLPYEQWMEGTDDLPFLVEIVEWDRANAIQCIAADLTVVAGYGSSTSASPVYCAPIMGNLIAGTPAVTGVSSLTNVNLTGTANMMAAVIGKYSHIGTNATTYPAAAVRGEIGGGSSAATAAFLAVLGGDPTTATSATAAFAVDYQNSSPIGTNRFVYGLDLAGASHDGYNAVAYGTADIRFSSGGLLATFTTAITANTTTTSLAAGTLGKTTSATGQASLFVSDGTKWQFLTNS